MIRTLADQGKTILISSHILTELAEICDVVGIIERGRLLAVGTVEEIRQQGQRPQNAVHVSVLDVPSVGRIVNPSYVGHESAPPHGLAALGQWLAQRPGVSELELNGDTARFFHAGDRQAEADLLRSMIEAGFRVVAFGSQKQTLEDVFMQVTEGKVQ